MSSGDASRSRDERTRRDSSWRASTGSLLFVIRIVRFLNSTRISSTTRVHRHAEYRVLVSIVGSDDDLTPCTESDIMSLRPSTMPVSSAVSLLCLIQSLERNAS
jgi:hypothetical protein